MSRPKKGEAAKPKRKVAPENLETMRRVAEHARTFIDPKNKADREQSHYKPEYARIARAMCKRGATNTELGDAFGVTRRTITYWQTNFEDFAEALKVGKGEYDDRVERSYAERAVGYEVDAVKVFMPAGATEPVYAYYREHIPADPGAAKSWLCVRRSKEWHDRKELTGADGAPLMPIVALLAEVADTSSLVEDLVQTQGAPALADDPE